MPFAVAPYCKVTAIFVIAYEFFKLFEAILKDKCLKLKIIFCRNGRFCLFLLFEAAGGCSAGDNRQWNGNRHMQSKLTTA